MSVIMSRPQCVNPAHLRRDPKQIDCLQSRVFWWFTVRRRWFQIVWVAGWYIVHPPYYHSPKHTLQSVNCPNKYGGFFDIFPFICGWYTPPVHMLKSLKNLKKIKTVAVISYPPHLTILAWVFSYFFYWLTTKCPHVIPKCEQLSYQYIQPTLVTYNKSCEWCEVKKKSKLPKQEPRGRFSVQLLWAGNRHDPDWLWHK